MDEQVARTLARRASPYGLALLPVTPRPPAADPPSEAAIQQQWQRQCEKLGGAILGIRDVPTQPVVAQLEGVRWLLEPYGARERQAPDYVFNRVRAFEGAKVPFERQWWLWAEEQLPPLTRRLQDPLLIGVIRTAPGRGLFVLVARWYD